MQSAPIMRIAATVLSKCCAVSVSTVGTPVMSMIANFRACLHNALEKGLHHDLTTCTVESSDHRKRQNAVPQLYNRRRKLKDFGILPTHHGLALALERLNRMQTELVDQFRGLPDFFRE